MTRRRQVFIVVRGQALIIAAVVLVLAFSAAAAPAVWEVGIQAVLLEGRSSAVVAGAYYHGPADQPLMSLMINVDWGDEFIPGMPETLARYEVKTTWFPTGKWVTKSPELARRIVSAGHELGNHGGWHGLASRMSADEVRRLITEGEQAIVQVTGQKPTLFAPPSGDMNECTVAVATELGYKTVMWTLDTIDWKRPAPAVITQRVVGRAKNGALVLMHPTAPTAEALPQMIEQLLAKGFSLVTVSQLLGD